ncbi:MAG TPA: glycosyltransferase family 2 protein [Polyangiaceae bacterium]
MKTLAIVCPVWNEAEVIGAFHTALASALAPVADRYSWSVLYVVDRSPDATLEILRTIAAGDPRVRILSLSSRFGHQASLVAGIDHSDADALVMLDSDLQHPPELIPRLLEEFERGRDIVYTIREDAPGVGWFKRTTSRAFYRLINRLSQVPIQESAADFRLISRKVAAVFRTQIRERNQFLRGLFAWTGFSTAAVRFQVRPRGAGQSKYSLTRMVRFALSGITSFSKKPLEWAVLVGFLFALAGLAMAVITVGQYLFFSKLPAGWATLVILMSVFSGIQLIFLGIIGEYIGAIFDEVKARPIYIVDEKTNIDEDG